MTNGSTFKVSTVTQTKGGKKSSTRRRNARRPAGLLFTFAPLSAVVSHSFFDLSLLILSVPSKLVLVPAAVSHQQLVSSPLPSLVLLPADKMKEKTIWATYVTTNPAMSGG